MEHRWVKRLQKSVKVTLYNCSVPVAICKTRDIGTEGMFVSCGPLTLRNKTLFEIEFEVARNDNHKWYRLAAVPVHINDEGMGLFIRDNESEAAEAWRYVVHKADAHKSDASLNAIPISVVTRS